MANWFTKSVNALGENLGKLWDDITGETDRQFAQHQSDEAFERQKWLIKHQPEMQVNALRRAGMNPGLMSDGSMSVATPQIAAPNRLSPSMGESAQLFGTVFSNVLNARKLESEIGLLDSERDLNKANEGLAKEKVAEVRSVVKVNKETARNLIKTYDKICAEVKELESQDLLNLSLGSLYKEQTKTESVKRNFMDSQTHLNDQLKKESESKTAINWKQYNEVMPAMIRQINSDIVKNEAESHFLSAKTATVIQDVLMNRPNVAYACQYFHEIVASLGAENAKKYWTNIVDSLEARITHSKIKSHPALHTGKGDDVYMWFMSTLHQVTNDVASGIGAGLGLKGLFGK